MSRRTKRPRTKPVNLSEWAREYPEAPVRRRELLTIMGQLLFQAAEKNVEPAVEVKSDGPSADFSA